MLKEQENANFKQQALLNFKLFLLSNNKAILIIMFVWKACISLVENVFAV